MQIDYDEKELLELLNDIIAADNSRRQATSHLDIENFRDSGFFAFYNAIVKALQARGYVPEKVLSRACRKDSGNGRPDVPKGGGNGRQTRHDVNAVQATADSSDSDGDSDDDSGAGDDGTLMDNDSHSDLDSGASDTMDDSYDPRDRDYYYETGGCVVYVPHGDQHVHYAAYTGIIS